MNGEELNDFHKQRQVDLSRRLRHDAEHNTIDTRADIGLVQWFWPGEQDRVEQTIADMNALGIRHLRTGLSWADWCTDVGKEWYIIS